LLLLDDEVFRAGLFVRGFKNRRPIDLVVRVADDATVNVAVRFDVQNLAASGKSGERFGGRQFGDAGAHRVVAPAKVDFRDDARIAVVEEFNPSVDFRALNEAVVARMTVETDKHAVFRGFFGASAHFVGDLLVRIDALAHTAFESARNEQIFEADFCGEIGGLLEFVALDRVETGVRADRFDPDVVEHFLHFGGAIAVITGKFDAFVTPFGDFLDILRESVVVHHVAEGVKFEPDRNTLFILFVFGDRGGSERTDGGKRGSAKTGLQERTTIHHYLSLSLINPKQTSGKRSLNLQLLNSPLY